MIQRLDWDSNFFGRETGRLDIDGQPFSETAIPESYSFVYVFSDHLLPEEELKLHHGTIHLADEKRVYYKELSSIAPVADHVLSFSSDRVIPDRLRELAIQSGHYSRFSTDPHLSPVYFEQLYTTWLKRSVSREIADEVYVYETEGQIRGFVTLGIKAGRPDIGLIAVYSDDRSSGIGAKLMQAAENWASIKMNSNNIQVVTQGANEGACRFYERNGYAIDSVSYVYHWWKKNKL